MSDIGSEDHMMQDGSPSSEEVRSHSRIDELVRQELPEVLPAPVPEPATASSGRKPVEEHAKAKNTPAWLFAGAKAGEGWALGRELTEAEYDAAIERAGSHRLG